MHGDPGRGPHEVTSAQGHAVARVRGLAFSYGDSGRRALDGINLDVRAGEVLVLEGPSGGGKSTLLRALAGLVPDFHGGAVAGSVHVADHDALTLPPAALGGAAGIVFQDPEAQAVLGIVERDVAFGPSNAGLPADHIMRRVDAALEAAGASHLRGRHIDTLSSGERQRVAIAGVLARAPTMLLLDEPTSQLDAGAAAALATTLRRLADEGTAVVIAEHRAERVRPIADRVLAVCRGRICPALPTEERTIARGPCTTTAAPAARAEHLVASHGDRRVLLGASLTLVPGRVTALIGPNGSGKSTLLRALAGLHGLEGGRVLLGEEDVSALPPEARFPRLGLVPQDPGRHLLTERVDDEIAVALGVLGTDAGESARRVARIAREMGLEDVLDRHPLDLSVGERERVALAAILVAEPRVLLLDEPTRGMDPQRKRALAATVRRHAARGAAVLVATHDGPFATAIADEVLHMVDGGAVPTALLTP